MKTFTLYFLLVSAFLFAKHPLQAQSNIDLSDKQVLGYTLIGLGFTTVAYTYSGYNDLPNDANQRALFYSIGTGMAVTGILILISGPKKKSEQKLWSGINMVNVRSASYTSNHHYFTKLSESKILNPKQ